MGQPEEYSTRTLADHIGHDFGTSDPVVVDQAMINGFADVTGDHQWIHVDVERAQAQSPFGGPIPPLPWQTFAPPFSEFALGCGFLF